MFDLQHSVKWLHTTVQEGRQRCKEQGLAVLACSILQMTCGTHYVKTGNVAGTGLPIKVIFDMGSRRLQGRSRQVDGERVSSNTASIVLGVACCSTHCQHWRTPGLTAGHATSKAEHAGLCMVLGVYWEIAQQ